LKTDYEWLCSPAIINGEIDAEMFSSFLEMGNIDVIDVREPHESPAVSEFPNINIPLGQLPNNAAEIKADTVITFCQTGSRSLQAARILNGIFGESKKVYSLRGGILGWKKLKQSV
jgi:adenylyltransferase/sulfurtransferase